MILNEYKDSVKQLYYYVCRTLHSCRELQLTNVGRVTSEVSNRNTHTSIEIS